MRLPMNRKSPPVIVEYDGRNGTRVSKEFDDPYKARSFYGSKLKANKNPVVKKVESNGK